MLNLKAVQLCNLDVLTAIAAWLKTYMLSSTCLAEMDNCSQIFNTCLAQMEDYAKNFGAYGWLCLKIWFALQLCTNWWVGRSIKWGYFKTRGNIDHPGLLWSAIGLTWEKWCLQKGISCIISTMNRHSPTLYQALRYPPAISWYTN